MQHNDQFFECMSCRYASSVPCEKAAQMPLEQHQELLQVSQMWVATLQQLRAKFDEKTMTRLEDMFMQGLLSLNCQIQVFFPLAWQNAH